MFIYLFTCLWICAVDMFDEGHVFSMSNDDIREELDSGGHVFTDINMRTSVPGVYACGDARAESTRQLGSAVGDGITAALSAFHDLST